MPESPNIQDTNMVTSSKNIKLVSTINGSDKESYSSQELDQVPNYVDTEINTEDSDTDIDTDQYTLSSTDYYRLNSDGLKKAYKILLAKLPLSDLDLIEIRGLVNQFHHNRGYMDILLFQNILETMGSDKKIHDLEKYNISPGYRTISPKTIKILYNYIF